MPPPYATFLFDLDGTLLDSVELILSSYRHTLRAHRNEVPPDSVWLAGLGTPLRAQFRQFSNDDEEIAAMVATYREYNLAHHDAMARPFPGVPETVRALAAKGARIGLVTSKLRAGAFRGIARLGLETEIETTIGADDVGDLHKPHPEPVRAALRALGQPAASAVFVGDSPHDMAAGRSAGVATAAVMWGPFSADALEEYRPDHWINDPGELLPLAGDGR